MWIWLLVAVLAGCQGPSVVKKTHTEVVPVFYFDPCDVYGYTDGPTLPNDVYYRGHAANLKPLACI